MTYLAVTEEKVLFLQRKHLSDWQLVHFCMHLMHSRPCEHKTTQLKKKVSVFHTNMLSGISHGHSHTVSFVCR